MRCVGEAIESVLRMEQECTLYLKRNERLSMKIDV